MKITCPFELTGGIAAVRRDPSGRRASISGCDPVEPFPFDVLEQTLEDAQRCAVVREGDVGDALDPLAGVFEDPPGPVDHPLLCVGIGEHPLGELAKAEQVVTQFAPDLLELFL